MLRLIRLAILIVLIDVCLAQRRAEVLQCSKKVMEIAMNNCKAPKFKRSEGSTILDSGDGQREKRQYYPGMIPGMMPGMQSGYGGYGFPQMDIDKGSFHESQFSLPGIGFETQDSSFFHEDVGRPRPFYPMRYKSSGYNSAVKPDESDGLLGFDLTKEDLAEFYSEFADRMPRQSKDFDMVMFFNNVAKCCQDLKACRENPKLIPCMYS